MTFRVAPKTKGTITDDYMTPAAAWEEIQPHLPKDMLFYEPFHGDGSSFRWMTQHLGEENVVTQQNDFFKVSKLRVRYRYNSELQDFERIIKPLGKSLQDRHTGVCVLTNPRFSFCKEIFMKLQQEQTPFILLLPTQKLSTKYFKLVAVRAALAHFTC